MTKSFSGNGHQELEEGVPSRAAPTRALIIGPYSTRKSAARASGGGPSAGLAEERSASERLDEATKLAGAIDLVVVDSIIVPVNDIRPATYIGSGKVEELAARVKAEEIDLAVVDCALSPVQQRNLEKALGAKVIDRTALILEIFGERARTREGSLQVEHAHLTHQKSRLVRSWTHLERQRGGFGFLGGPGETQIEADRRQIEERIAKIERDLDAVKRTRALHRRQRRRGTHPVVALVGYTNAGKSTLFNRLTAAGVVAKDMLFATLDPTARLISLPHGESVYLIDTVGFISDLPTSLIAAFRATLEDVLDADLIIHVRDVSHAENEAQRRDVEDVLAELGLDRSSHPTLEVHNKIDLLHGERAPALANGDAAAADHEPIGISALTGDGIDELLAAIETMLFRNRDVFDLVIPGTDGRGRAWVYEHAEVLSAEEDTGGSARLMVRVSRDRSAELLRLVAAGGGEVSVHP
ncbi:GTP-binding protein HflX [Rhizobiales bacterium GAS113]|nr:GTP-binding protein HflX [Rhizobiales bacterium GAS113]